MLILNIFVVIAAGYAGIMSLSSIFLKILIARRDKMYKGNKVFNSWG